ncbi:hypothetical protein ACH5RR_004499 [Cinchona calisaya]|uniref:Late embryogenesis abundant protein LEA-2 subgroup domain-containing protein n=1 Tax=Cinchona calisaya TaxID=153742 RepID=A0ABD3AY48_9GENT
MSNDETTRPPVQQGYAPVGYPQPIPPPQQSYGYPYAPYPNQYNAAAAAPPPPGTAYYSSAQLPPVMPQSKGYAYVRIALITIIILMICTLFFSFIITWLVFGSGVPEFKVESFNVPDFEIANSTLKATWDFNVTVKNTNHKLKFSFADIQGSLIYKDTLVDVTMISPFHVEENNEGRIRGDFSYRAPFNGNSSDDASSLVNALVEERKSGIMEFDLRVFMETTFASHSFWSKKMMLRVLCGDLRVTFPGPTGAGTWNNKWVGKCLTYYYHQ